MAVISGTNEDDVDVAAVFLLPSKVIKQKENQNLITASALSRIYGRLSKFSEQKRFKNTALNKHCDWENGPIQLSASMLRG